MPNQYTDNPIVLVHCVCETCGKSFDVWPSVAAHGGTRWCSRACYRESLRQPEVIAARFWAKVDKNGPIPEHCPELGPCWLWMASLNSNGYGQFGCHVNGKKRPIAASRVAWELTNGPLAEGRWALHKCDNPRCVNPAHLFEGDAKTNVDDMVDKGRNRFITPPSGKDHWMHKNPERIPRGERSGKAKATAAIVREIRECYVPAHGAISALAHAYGLNWTTIDNIIKRKTWNHI